MSAPGITPAQQPSGGDGLGAIYWVIGGVLVVLVIIGLITYSGEKKDQEAKDKAAQLTQKFEAAGLRVPQDQDILVRSLGTDGGAICDNPGDAFGKALLFDQLTNGAAQVGRRPIIADRRAVLGQLMVMQTYCPDKLDDYRDAIDDLKFDDVIKE